MKNAFIDEVARRRDEVRQRWRVALRHIPVHTALGNPDTLAFMIEPTLNRLFAAVSERREAPWLPAALPEMRLVEAASRCGLNPMIAYFLAGESAIVAVTRSIRGCGTMTESEMLTAENELLATLRELGRGEITGFCGICQVKHPTEVTTHPSAAVPTDCPFKAQERKTAG
jgi:hypothetical protein